MAHICHWGFLVPKNKLMRNGMWFPIFFPNLQWGWWMRASFYRTIHDWEFIHRTLNRAVRNGITPPRTWDLWISTWNFCYGFCTMVKSPFVPSFLEIMCIHFFPSILSKSKKHVGEKWGEPPENARTVQVAKIFGENFERQSSGSFCVHGKTCLGRKKDVQKPAIHLEKLDIKHFK